MSEVDPAGAAHLRHTVTSSSGVQIGDGNVQFNLFQTESTLAARSTISQSADEELNTLTGWGLMRVPWTQLDTARPTVTHLTEHEHLAHHVATGGRLLILGAQRSGKTTLAARLSKLIPDCQGNRQAILFRLPEWPQDMPLFQWFSRVLDDSGIPEDQLQQTLDALKNGRIVAILDGFDEIDAGSQFHAAEVLRRFSSERPTVLTGIPTDENTRALHHALPGATVIRLDPVEPEEVGRYLLDDIDDFAQEACAEFAAELTSEQSSPLREALTSPLFAWLVKTVYAAPAQTSGPITSLINRFTTAAEVEEHLLRQLVPAVFRGRATDPAGKGPADAGFAPDDATRWLGFLSYRAVNGAVAFWEIRTYVPMYRLGAAAALLLGIMAGLLGWIGPVPPAVYCAFLLAGVVFGFGFSCGYSDGRWRATDDPDRTGYLFAKKNASSQIPGEEPRRPDGPKDGSLRSHSIKLAKGVSMAAIAYLVAQAIWAIHHSSHAWRLGLSASQLIAVTASATAAAAVIAYTGGRIAVPVLTRLFPEVNKNVGARTPDPIKVIRNDRRSGIGMAVLAAVVMLSGYVVYWLIWRPPGGLWGLPAALIAAAAALLFWNQWAPFVVAHTWLVVAGRLPRPVATFLTACHEGGILYKRGNHFIFRHQRLQACLAEMYREEVMPSASM